MPAPRKVARHRVTPTLQSSISNDVTASSSSMNPNIRGGEGDMVPQAEYDLVIFGSGPSALALLSRVLEERPAALYTDNEQSHLSWLQTKTRDPTHRGRTTLKTYRSPHGVHIKAKDTHDICHRLLRRCACPRVLVIDKLGQGWMGVWNRSFEAFQIPYLRSPMFFHPSPSGLDDLLTYAQRVGRDRIGHPSCLWESPPSHQGGASRKKSQSSSNNASLPDLIEICGVVGKESSKHKKKKDRAQADHRRRRATTTDLGVNVNERAREDFYTPSAGLFAEFIKNDVIKRYGLPGLDGPWKTLSEILERQQQQQHDEAAAAAAAECQGEPELTVAKGEVSEVEWRDDGTCICGSQDSGFLLKMASGEMVAAKAVVSAVGPGGMPAVPAVLLPKNNDPRSNPAKGSGWCHSAALAMPHGDQEFKAAGRKGHAPVSPAEKRLLVIGGGLTSAQIVDLALKHQHYDKVTLVLRGHLKCKPFDVGTEWMGKYANLHKMQFWQEEDAAERLQMLRDARQGGSVTPPYLRVLRKWEEAGKLNIMPFTEILSAKWDDEAGKTHVELKQTTKQVVAACDQGGPAVNEEKVTESTVDFDYIVAATGAKLAFDELPFTKSMLASHPLELHGGLPVLNDDLQWNANIPFFVIGPYCALSIGPAAFNLGGHREAADRIATRLGELSLAEDAGSSSAAVPTTENDYPLSFTHFGFEALSTA